ncbi:MAG: hypothetical protein EXS14_09080 [Planctomycetes bacterium]|nr:hypothetical protein [Planctomycetota bacterium]
MLRSLEELPVRLLMIVAVGLLVVGVRAQNVILQGHADARLSWKHDSGWCSNPAAYPAVAHTHVLYVPGAPALRVVFDIADIGPSDWIDVSSPLTGEVHRLTRAELAKWDNSSAYFNGDTLLLSMTVAPGSTGKFSITQVIAGVIPPQTDTLCGTDNRIPSTDNRSMRLVSSPTSTGGGCTIWLAGSADCALTAGHCFTGSLSVAEANVPPSTSGGAAQHPSVQNQFSVNAATKIWNSGGVGNDYGVCKLNANNLGQSATTLFGSFVLNTAIPSAGTTMRITGYGTDSGASNVTNQTSTGPYSSTSGTSVRYAVDSMGGNSGSPVIRESDGNAVGIHTHGGCTSTGGANSGTSLSLAAFQTAYQNICGGTPPPTPLTLAIPVINAGATVTIGNIPSTATSGFTLFSMNTTAPVNTTTTTIGLSFDSLTQGCLFTAVAPGDFFHWTWPVSSPVYPAAPMVFPPGSLVSLAGLSMDAQAMSAGATTTYSGVVRITF